MLLAKYKLYISMFGHFTTLWMKGLKHFIGSKAFLEYLNYIDDIYRNIKECKTE